ncbi:hypothetical protein FACS1894147_03900 [Spirochaetia bacterium]|nr:hypothetical protein FACS1894147_03900 [Spirochaetia bacterium]
MERLVFKALSAWKADPRKKLLILRGVIFDEIQFCPKALSSLKYFCENAPEYHVVSAGSLLGRALSGSFPVGKADYIQEFAQTKTSTQAAVLYNSGLNSKLIRNLLGLP